MGDGEVEERQFTIRGAGAAVVEIDLLTGARTNIQISGGESSATLLPLRSYDEDTTTSPDLCPGFQASTLQGASISFENPELPTNCDLVLMITNPDPAPRAASTVDVTIQTALETSDWRFDSESLGNQVYSGSASFGFPDATQEGDLLVAFLAVDTYYGSTNSVGEPARQFDGAEWNSVTYTPDIGGSRALRIMWREADAIDETNAGGAPIYNATWTITNSDDFFDFDQFRPQVVAVRTSARPVGGPAAKLETGVSRSPTLTTSDGTLGTADWRLVLAHVNNTSHAGSRLGYIREFGDDTLNVTQSKSGTSSAPANPYDAVGDESGVGFVAPGNLASVWSAGLTSGSLSVVLSEIALDSDPREHTPNTP